ncbi:hypothetical protein SUNI508_11760 [Seiridium unicorne]|uniref:Transcription factor domain-containing protein n=1 Tax=Seiridium unicorne TaxID=138068 RepID=A0ABR2UGP4_9PEZI
MVTKGQGDAAWNPQAIQCRGVSRNSQPAILVELQNWPAIIRGPFVRDRKKHLLPSVAENRESLIRNTRTSLLPADDVGSLASTPHQYPNPGYLGPLSHTTIFGHLPGTDDQGYMDSSTPNVDRYMLSEGVAVQADYARAAKVIARLDQVFTVTCESLVRAWLATGANLALTGRFTQPCLQTLRSLFLERGDDPLNALEVSKNLFLHSLEPLTVARDATIDDFLDTFCQKNARWETLGLTCVAISRAVTDTPAIGHFYNSERERRELQRHTVELADLCLEMALSLDCMNDLQLMLQYETFILHSLVDGDQSYQSWRRLGDVASSLFALGYHQQMEKAPSVPDFLHNLRRSVFAQAYSADKNVSIFLGRPPRISKKFCRFNLLKHHCTEAQPNTSEPQWWNQGSIFDYMLDIQWSALCATLKEDILLLFEAEEGSERDRNAGAIQADAERHWSSLPLEFRLEGPLRLCNQPPVIRDFMLSARLNHLHVLFLLRLALSHQKPQSDPGLIKVSAEILTLIAEALMQKDQLVNSGISLVWKVAYFGLSAAGVICQWLLQQPSASLIPEINVSKIFQKLSVIVAEVETGTIVRNNDPNYKLLASASQTISCLLDRLLLEKTVGQNDSQVMSDFATSILNPMDQDGWNAWESHALQDFESDFWTNLAEHPFLH